METTTNPGAPNNCEEKLSERINDALTKLIDSKDVEFFEGVGLEVVIKIAVQAVSALVAMKRDKSTNDHHRLTAGINGLKLRTAVKHGETQDLLKALHLAAEMEFDLRNERRMVAPVKGWIEAKLGLHISANKGLRENREKIIPLLATGQIWDDFNQCSNWQKFYATYTEHSAQSACENCLRHLHIVNKELNHLCLEELVLISKELETISRSCAKSFQKYRKSRPANPKHGETKSDPASPNARQKNNAQAKSANRPSGHVDSNTPDQNPTPNYLQSRREDDPTPDSQSEFRL